MCWVNKQNHFAGLMEHRTGKEFAFAFTSPEKAKTFLRITRKAGLYETVNRLFPCTLAEYFELQEKKKFPDLAVDPDPEQIRDYPLIVGDTAKHNITSLTIDLPQGGNVYKITVTPRQNGNE